MDKKLRLALLCLGAGAVVNLVHFPVVEYLAILAMLAGLVMLMTYRLDPDQKLSLQDIAYFWERSHNKDVLLGGVVVLVGILLIAWGTMSYAFSFRLIGIVAAAAGVYLVIKRPAQPGVEADADYREGDRQTTRELVKRQLINKTVGVGRFVFIILASIPVILSAIFGAWGLLVVFVLIFVIVLAWIDSRRRDTKSVVADSIVRTALEEVFQVDEYKPTGCIPWQRISGRDFGIVQYNTVSGSDYIKGSYKGLSIEMCDIRLSLKGTSRDDDGHLREYDDTAFRGLWLICNMGRELAADIRLWARLGRQDKEDIITENDSFNQKFHIRSTIAEEAFYILTPHMMEYILAMNEKVKGYMHIRFDRSGEIQIAISTDHDSFEVGAWEANATRLRKKFVGEIRQLTDLIDELQQVATLYKQK